MRLVRLLSLLVIAAAATGCTADNPNFAADQGAQRDLVSSPLDFTKPAGGPIDFAVPPNDLPPPPPPDIAMPVLDFTIVDFQVPFDSPGLIDLARPPVLDFTTVDVAVSPDLLAPPDLAGADLVACGNGGQVCCGNNSCTAPGTVCVNNICVLCGGLGQTCCARNTCGANAACNNNVCVACGAAGQICCPGAMCGNNGCCDRTNLCVAANGACQTGDLCMNGQCANCGAAGNACCKGATCNNMGCCTASNACIANGGNCGGSSTCIAGTCCGQLNASCCPNNVCNQGQCDLLQMKCTACGGPGQPCCANNMCTNGGCCLGGTCLHAGRSCGNGMLCANGACGACGGANQPCCENATCANGGCCVTGRTCVANNTSCGNTCANGGCGTCNMGTCVNGNIMCGGLNRTCCVTQANNTPNFCGGGALACRGGIPGQCQGCGGTGQPCCDAGVCNNGGCCQTGNCVANNANCANGAGQCRNNSCGAGTCGVIGQPCCGNGGNAFCSGPNALCINAVCQGCGGKGERACFDIAANQFLICEPPYVVTPMMGVNYCQ